MKARVFKVAMLTLALFLSCSKGDRDIATGAQACGTLSGMVISTDEGLSLHIAELGDELSGGELPNGERVIATFDVLSKRGEGSYDICLTAYAVPLCKPCVEQSELEVIDTLGTDPIYVMGGWSSGGYMNLHLAIPFLPDVNAGHLLNMVHLDGTSDTLHFELRHNGHGYGSTYPDKDNGYKLGGVYASFPTSQYVPSDKEAMPVRIASTWFVDSLTLGRTVFTGTISR